MDDHVTPANLQNVLKPPAYHMTHFFSLAALSVALIFSAAPGLVTTATAQQGPPGGPPPDQSTPVQADQLFETWNDRVSAGPPVHVFPVVDGWSMGHAMPLARSEHAVAELDGTVWVLGGYPPGRLPSNLVQVYDPATSRWSLGPALPHPIHHIMAAAVDGKL